MTPKEIGRFIQINRTLCEYGLDEVMPRELWPTPLKFARRGLFFWRNRHNEKPLGQRIRLALEALGPVFVKFGQMLSTRRDLLPPDVANELAQLQDQVPPFPGQQARQKVELSLGQPLESIFESFELEPLASASIAQVHCAKLHNHHAEVVVKVIRPGIEPVIQSDLALMTRFARLLAYLVPEARRLRPVEVVDEYRKTLVDELDLAREAANAIQLRRNFEGERALYIPEVYSDYCRKDMLVMERIYGIPVSDIDSLQAQNTNMKLLAERGVEVFFTQVFRDSFFHADMHPGNIFVSRDCPQDPQYIGIDCGIVGTLNRADQRYLAENFLAFFNRDYRRVAQLHVDSGWVPGDTKVEEFEGAIRTVCEPIFEKPLSEISFGHVLLNLFNTARRFNMQVQPQLVLLQKTLLYVEGLGRQLYPQLDLWATAKPFLEEWMLRQVGPKAFAKGIQEKAPYWVEKLPELPELVFDNLQLSRRLLQRIDSDAERYMRQNQSQSRALFYGILAGACLVSAVIVWPYQQELASGLMISAAVLAIFGGRNL